VLAAMGEQLDTVLDVTVVYPDGRIPGFWDLLCGSVSKVIVDIRALPIERALVEGCYESDPVFREKVQGWVNGLWVEKDQRIAELCAQ